MDFSGLPLGNYGDFRHIAFLASRGCIQQCVFCSSKVFWPGYRRMSGKRIFEEVLFHKKMNSEVGHIDFLDLMFNGDIKTLDWFCDLMLGSVLMGKISWTANVIIRPEMTPELLKKMKRSGCKHLIYGIESGSQRVLDLMKKRYRIEDANKVIRATHEAGITATANFMFGFPGEEEADFMQTLDFVKRNAAYLDRVYPSRTFCAIEEFSYLHTHLNEYGVKPSPPNHLYWESSDGKNIYPERLKRCEEFCELASSLGIEVGCGVQTSVELDRWFNLAHYYENKKDSENALDCYLKYRELEPNNEVVTEKIVGYAVEAEKDGDKSIISPGLLQRLEKALNTINSSDICGVGIQEPIRRIGREKSIAMIRIKQAENSKLNDLEFSKKQTVLYSTPKAFFIQASGPCNCNCVFCSRDNDYEMFDLEKYKKRFEEKMYIFLTGQNRLFLPARENFCYYLMAGISLIISI
jgi:hypothetical protein